MSYYDEEEEDEYLPPTREFGYDHTLESDINCWDSKTVKEATRLVKHFKTNVRQRWEHYGLAKFTGMCKRKRSFTLTPTGRDYAQKLLEQERAFNQGHT